MGLALVLAASPALANPELVVDVDSGQVLLGRQLTADWYPAALTTLMTVYVALNAVRDGRRQHGHAVHRLEPRGEHAAIENGSSSRACR